MGIDTKFILDALRFAQAKDNFNFTVTPSQLPPIPPTSPMMTPLAPKEMETILMSLLSTTTPGNGTTFPPVSSPLAALQITNESSAERDNPFNTIFANLPNSQISNNFDEASTSRNANWNSSSTTTTSKIGETSSMPPQSKHFERSDESDGNVSSNSRCSSRNRIDE
ncbi:unnamed protein product [Caenorhabditis bovis]|uniref:Uncharacterized protein n=1 Tax=Caenorhabditis bovis TaxID=2654633 RepID=A0A8S1F1A8_9PELO|nr:unnamed protein product [Caenorhabditis bovis]